MEGGQQGGKTASGEIECCAFPEEKREAGPSTPAVAVDGERRPAREAELTDLTMGHGVFWGLDAIF